MPADPPLSVYRDGALLTVRVDRAAADQPLALAMQFRGVALSIQLTRDDVRDLVEGLDGWLYESRPA